MNNNIVFQNYLQFKIIKHCWKDLNKFRIKNNEKFIDNKIHWKLNLILVNWQWFKYIRDNLVKNYSFEHKQSNIYKNHFINKYSIFGGKPKRLRISTQNVELFLNLFYESNNSIKGVETFFSELKELEILVNCNLDFNDYDILFSSIEKLKVLTIVFRETMTFNENQYDKLIEYLSQSTIYEKFKQLKQLNFQSVIFTERFLKDFQKIQLPMIEKFKLENYDSNTYSLEIFKKINSFKNIKELHLVYPLDFEFFLNSHTLFLILLKNEKIEILNLDLTDRDTFTMGGNDNQVYIDFFNIYLKNQKNLKKLKLKIHSNQNNKQSTVYQLIEFLFTSNQHQIIELDCNLSIDLPLPFKLISTINNIKGIQFNNCNNINDCLEPINQIINKPTSKSTSTSFIIPKNQYPLNVIEYFLLSIKSKSITIDFSIYGIEQLNSLKNNKFIKFLNIVGLDLEKYQNFLDQIILFMSNYSHSIILTTIIMDRKHIENRSIIVKWKLLESKYNKTYSNCLLIWSEINNYYKFNFINSFEVKIFKKQ